MRQPRVVCGEWGVNARGCGGEAERMRLESHVRAQAMGEGGREVRGRAGGKGRWMEGKGQVVHTRSGPAGSFPACCLHDRLTPKSLGHNLQPDEQLCVQAGGNYVLAHPLPTVLSSVLGVTTSFDCSKWLFKSALPCELLCACDEQGTTRS